MTDLRKIAETAVSTEGQGMSSNEVLALARDWLLLDEVAKAAEHLGIERNHILGEWNPICYQYGIVRLVEALEALRKHRTPVPKEKA